MVPPNKPMEIAPDTKVSAPLRTLLSFCATVVLLLSGFTVWSVKLFNRLDNLEDGLSSLKREVGELRVDFAHMSRSDVRHHEMNQWLELMRAKNPDTTWAEFPYTPR